MKLIQARKVMLVTSAVIVAGCASVPGQPHEKLVNQLRQTFASDDPCSDNARNIGMAGGALLGLVVGNSIGDGRSGAMATGVLVGGLVGRLIGSDLDRKRCELSKVAKQYDLVITYSNVNSNGEVSEAGSRQFKASDGSSEQPTIVGSTLTVRDKDGSAGHFVSGSDQLTPRAREYFSAIAAQYNAEQLLTAQTDPQRREELGKALAQRRLFLIGHTDDTGKSRPNAALSERRAKSVANFLKQQGIAENSLYFQGAGETLPVADNRKDLGRAANRRVEIIEVADESSFNKYLAARKPNYQFYRPAQLEESTSTASQSAGKPTRPPLTAVSAARTQKSTPVDTQKTAQTTKLTVTPKTMRPAIDFGGQPYSALIANLNIGPAPLGKIGFSLFSKAYADDSVVYSDCTRDRPRAAGTVKSLRDGSSYKTNDHFPQLYGKTWADDVNGNLVVLNRLAILRDGGTPANLPELKVYAQYKPGSSKKPEVNEEPQVNSYLVEQGVLYRMFPRGDAGLKCMDLLLSTDGNKSAQAGKLVYTAGSTDFVADFKPQLQ